MCDQRRVKIFIKLFLVGLFATLGLSDSINNVTNQVGSSIILPLTGNVYPKGHFSTTLKIGNPPKLYVFDVDTASDVTWLQCDPPDGTCKSCFLSPTNPRYKAKKEDIVKYKDPLCAMLDKPRQNPEGQCIYNIDYTDTTSTSGFLVRDSYTFELTNGRTVAPRLGIGCSYDQKYSKEKPPPKTDGVLAMGNEKLSIVTQLHNQGLIRDIFGHCLSTQGNGYVFMGDNVVPPGIVWAPIKSKEQYIVGPAEFLYDGQSTSVTGLSLAFDSGHTYTLFNSQAYDALLNQLTKTMTQNKFIPVKDPDFSACWKGPQKYKSVSDVKNLFKTLTLSFTQLTNVQLQLPPEAYLIVTAVDGYVCLGIKKNNYANVQVRNLNIIGDISMLDKMVIYDKEKQQVGWVAANCNNKPSMS